MRLSDRLKDNIGKVISLYTDTGVIYGYLDTYDNEFVGLYRPVHVYRRNINVIDLIGLMQAYRTGDISGILEESIKPDVLPIAPVVLDKHIIVYFPMDKYPISFPEQDLVGTDDIAYIKRLIDVVYSEDMRSLLSSLQSIKQSSQGN